MADFDLPFADSGERRFPTTDEQANGFGCGPASLPLFNGMFWAIQSEVGAVISAAGISQSNSDMTQLLQAINALIEAATGGGETSSYLLLSQARARLPIYPEVQNSNGHFGVTTPATGQVRVPAGVTFQHRGIFPVTTIQTDFATDASKTYHLRWNPADGFVLKDLASGTYNPSTLGEANAAFDTAYDDMLVARVITNSSNVPTITNLVNKSSLSLSTLVEGTNKTGSGNPTTFDVVASHNWSRRPATWSFVPVRSAMGTPSDMDYNIGPLGTSSSALQNAAPVFDLDRYRVSQTVLADCLTALTIHFSAGA